MNTVDTNSLIALSIVVGIILVIGVVKLLWEICKIRKEKKT